VDQVGAPQREAVVHDWRASSPIAPFGRNDPRKKRPFSMDLRVWHPTCDWLNCSWVILPSLKTLGRTRWLGQRNCPDTLQRFPPL